MTDNRDELICPACNNMMKKVFIPEHGIMVDICVEGCGGIWFDNREDLKFDEQHESIEHIVNELKGRDFVDVDTTKVRYCPVCAMKMVKNFSSVKRNVEIDECYNCGGKFYDRNELIEVRKEYATEDERIKDLESVSDELYGDILKKQAKELAEMRKNHLPLVGGLNQALSSAFINREDLS